MTTTPASPPHPGSLVKRSVVALIVAAVFAAVCWADVTGFMGARPGHWLVLVAGAFAVGGSLEVVRMAAARGVFLRRLLVPVATASLAILPLAVHDMASSRMLGMDTLALALSGVLAVMVVVEIAGYRRDTGALTRLVAGFATVAAIGLPLAFMMRLRLLPATSGLLALVPLASMLAVVKGGDVAAYLVGSRLGRNRMALILSPGKTWEGAVASLAASLAIAWLFIEVFHGVTARPLGGWLVYGLAVGIAGMVGDLAESLVKRELDAKDSGHSLGALGGFLDLVDATLLAAPVAWFLWIWSDLGM